jgi:hypothetical protein
LARSPVTPKMTTLVGWTGRRSRPSTRGFSSVGARDATVVRLAP